MGASSQGAFDHQIGAGDETRSRACEKHRRIGHFVGRRLGRLG